MKRILVVSGDAAYCSRSCNMLGLCAFEATGVATGAEALRFMATYHASMYLVLFDAEVSDMTGLKFLHLLNKSKLSVARIPVVLVVNGSSAEFSEQAKLLGATHTISKPFSLPFNFPIPSRRAIPIEPVEADDKRLSHLPASLQGDVVMALNLWRQVFSAVRTRGELPFEFAEANCLRMFNVLRNKDAVAVLKDLAGHDAYTVRHSIDVGLFTMLLAAHMRYSEKLALGLAGAGIFHDVGKILMPTEILNAPRRLEPAELALMQTHTTMGAKLLLGTLGVPAVAVDIAHHHHERMDGTGYPERLSGEVISLAARMAAVADAYSALTNQRSYKPGIPYKDALEKLHTPAGHLDQELVRQFHEAVRQKPQV